MFDSIRTGIRRLETLVLDKQQPGREASWAAAGMLSAAPDSPRDIPLVPLAKESLRLYPDFVRTIEEQSAEATRYARNGTLQIFIAPCGEEDRDRMVIEHRRLGLTAEPVSLEATRAKESLDWAGSAIDCVSSR